MKPWRPIYKDTLRSEIGLVVKKLSEFDISFGFRTGSDGKILTIDKLSQQNILNTIENHEICHKFGKIFLGFYVLGVTL